MDGDPGSWRGIGYGIFFANRRSDRSYKRWKCGNNSYTNRCFWLISVFPLLVFFYLQHMVFVFATAIFLGFHLFHAAFATGMCFLYGKIPVYQFAHAVMQVYRGAHRGAQVKDGQYGNKELFHVPVKIYRFFGTGFIKFGEKLTEFKGRTPITDN